MNNLPTELLGDIVNQAALTTRDVLNVARVSRLFSQLAAARLYRSGELSYPGTTEREMRKVQAFSKHGTHVRTLTLNLCPHSSSPASLIPNDLPHLLRTLTNLHSFTLLDAASLPWPLFTSLLAGLLTTHFALKHLELQCTLLSTDGAADSDLLRAREILAAGKRNIPKLDSFTLRLCAKEGFINRCSIDQLIEILQPATRTAKIFQYSCDFRETTYPTPSKPLSTRTHRTWEWDNLETLSLKLPSTWTEAIRYAGVTPLTQTVLGTKLHTVTNLTVKIGNADIIPQLNHAFENGLSSLPALQHLRISLAGTVRMDSWEWKNAQPSHPFYILAETLPRLKTIEQVDPYYMTRVIQSYAVVRSPEQPDKIAFDRMPL
ncbi:hypothetical protein ABW21_db0203974 [Orbilia brochopaga]|nr:hypothetical protein ABW21_db0203974 [Drechslerella brochopaga]